MDKVILIAADNQARIQTMTEILEQAGYKVTDAANYSEVVAALHRAGADLLLIDSRLPGMNQFNLVERLTGRGNSSRSLSSETTVRMKQFKLWKLEPMTTSRMTEIRESCWRELPIY